MVTVAATVAAMSRPRAGVLVAGIATAIAAISSAALAILLADPLDSTVIAAGRVVVTALVMSLIAGSTAAVPWRAAARDPAVRWRMLLAASLLALHFAAWIASLTMTTVVRSVTLVATQPLFAALIGRWLGDRASWRSYAAGAVAVLGTAVMFAGQGGGLGSEQAVDANLGDALALAAAAAAAGYLAVGRSLRDRLPLPAYLGVIHLWAAAILVVVVWVRDAPWVPPGTQWPDLAAVVYLGLVPGVVGHGLLNWAVRSAPVHVVSLAVVVEPVAAAGLAVAVLGGSVSAWEVGGATIVLVAVALGAWRPPTRQTSAGR